MIKLNLGRNCLKIIIRAYGIKKIFIPYYSCNILWKAVRQENCEISFYHIDKIFLPVCEFGENDFILYINYFGLFEDNVISLCNKYKNIIVDNTQSFYSQPYGLACFNSLRKFFPVQSGAYLWGVNGDIENNFQDDNLKLKITDINSNYDLFKKNELILNNESIKKIASDVEIFMKDFDFEKDKNIRLTLFKKYSQIFDKYNLIQLPHLKNCIPYCYPLCTNNTDIIKKIEQNKIIILKLWNEFLQYSPDYRFISNVGAIPLDNETLAEKILNLFY